MKQILQNLKSGETILAEAPAPAEQAGCVSIETRCSLVSAGTERMLVEFGNAGFIGKAKAQPDKVKQVLDKMRTDGVVPTVEAVFRKLDEPLPMGYCNVGIVDAVQGSLLRADATAGQASVQRFEHGDRVVNNGAHAEVVSVPERPPDQAKCGHNLSVFGLYTRVVVESQLANKVKQVLDRFRRCRNLVRTNLRDIVYWSCSDIGI